MTSKYVVTCDKCKRVLGENEKETIVHVRTADNPSYSHDLCSQCAIEIQKFVAGCS